MDHHQTLHSDTEYLDLRDKIIHIHTCQRFAMIFREFHVHARTHFEDLTRYLQKHVHACARVS